jgi:hypothetical protein
MARTKNDKGVDAVRKAREDERVAIGIARAKIKMLVENETRPYHEKVLEAIKQAMFAGASKRQIAIAYGTTDAGTITRLIAEATQETVVQEATDSKPASAWEYDKATSTLTVYGFGDSHRSGSVVITLDEDGENITAVSGDLWIIPIAYRTGEVPNIVKAMK